MARSNYIYLILADGLPCAAFTVKYEMEVYLDKLDAKLDDAEIDIFRMKDNPSVEDGAPVDITNEFYN